VIPETRGKRDERIMGKAYGNLSNSGMALPIAVPRVLANVPPM
jgi:hypothetical protein